MHCRYKYSHEPKLHGYGEDVRRQALQLYVDGMSLRQIGRLLGLHHSTVSVWVKASAAGWTAVKPEPSVKLFSRDNTALRFWAALFLVGILAFSLRAINVGDSFNIFIDEITYLQISQSVASNLHVQLHGQPFYLHPPAYFFIEAAYLKVFQPAGDMIQTIYATRFINIMISSLSAILLFCIGYRAMSWTAGLIIAILFGLNPFIIKINSLNILEASAIGCVVAGYWIIISSIHEKLEPWLPFWIPKGLSRFFPNIATISRIPKFGEDPSGHKEEIGPLRMILAGIFFGIALLIKESTGFISIIPLLVLLILNWSIPRRAAGIISIIACLTYSIYPIAVYLAGDWGLFTHQKFRGLQRFLGIIKITGFNRPVGTSLADTLIHQMELYGTTYIIIILGIIATLFLLSSRGRLTRLIGIWTASAYAMMIYLIFLGTLEEQFFIYLVVPCTLACAVAIGLLRKSFIFEHMSRKLLIALMILFFSFVSWDSIQWANTHFIPDNSYEQVLTYLRDNIPGGTRVASTSEIGQYVLSGYESGPWGLWHTVAELKEYQPEYLIVTPKTVEWNYGPQAKDLLGWVEKHGIPIYIFQGREGDDLILYRIDWRNGR